MLPSRLIAATRNPAKLAELSRLFAGIAEVSPLPHDISPELSGETDPEEGSDLAGIAAAKAIAASRALGGEAAVASDGGLLVPALGDAWNSARTRRFAGEAASDLERAQNLISLAAGLTGADRRIGWREAVAVARSGEIIATWTAESDPGMLATEVDERLVLDGNGFWIPAVWRCPELGGRLLATLTETERDSRTDHWSRLRSQILVSISASS